MINEKVIVKRVNELYHDLTADNYDTVYNLMIEDEKKRWSRIAYPYLQFDYPLQILDIGTGSGVIPLSICKFLKSDDMFICSDISEKMLRVAGQNIKKDKFYNQFKLLKLSSSGQESLPFSNNSIDIITMNAVLHHIDDTNIFLEEIDRVLKHNGFIFIAHEPNKYFYENKLLFNLSNLLYYFIYPKAYVYKIISIIGLGEIIERCYCALNKDKEEKKFKSLSNMDKINKILIQEKLITEPLTSEEIEALVDIKSKEGFYFDKLFNNYEMIYYETYNFIPYVSDRFFNVLFVRNFEKIAMKKYDMAGANFFVVYKKP